MAETIALQTCPAVFIDRDGTLNVEKNYLYKIEDWEWIPGAVEAIQKLNHSHFKVIVVSNQAGIARGYYDEKAVQQLHEQVDQRLAEQGAHIDGYYFCPHHPEFGEKNDCHCRKPKPGMLEMAARDFSIDLGNSFMIGDKLSDIEAGLQAGVTPILVKTGYGQQASRQCPASVMIEDDLLAAVNSILTMYSEEKSI